MFRMRANHISRYTATIDMFVNTRTHSEWPGSINEFRTCFDEVKGCWIGGFWLWAE